MYDEYSLIQRFIKRYFGFINKTHVCSCVSVYLLLVIVLPHMN